MTVQVLLGPQSPRPNLRAAFDAISFDGPIVCISAGWRDGEGEVEEIRADLGQEVHELGLYRRADEILAREPELLALHRARQEKLKVLQQLYRIRLAPTLSAARQLLQTEGHEELLRHEQRAAITQLRNLDRHHLRRIAAIHQEFDLKRRKLDLPEATAERDALRERVRDAGVILITGGHVAVLLNRIRLFRLGELLAEKPVVAWSAGAMVLGQRIVLFHDNAPQGARNAEVMDAGLDIVPKLIPLPHAKTRLDWSSRSRMALFSRRFAPSRCCTLDHGSMIRIEGGEIVEASGSSVMTRSGKKKKLVAK